MKNSRLPIVLAALSVLAGLSAPLDVGAGVSQVPLTGTATQVAPNVMFTLDDSGSMEFECVPDPLCVASDGKKGENYVGTVPWEPLTFKNTVATYDSEKLFARKMRSGMNALYYNPNVRYRPWLNANGSRFPEYPARAAPPNPHDPGKTVDLEQSNSVSARWCQTAEKCDAGGAPTSQTFQAAQYYVLTPGKEGKALSDFTHVFITSPEELQNFSNWFTYARNRFKVAIAGTSEAFGTVPASFRVGYGTINSSATVVDEELTNTVRSGVRPFAGDAKRNFYEMLQGASYKGATPLLRAMDDVGRYFSRHDKNSPWATDPVSGQAPASHLSCRRAVHILMTDGAWRGDGPSTVAATADVDGVDGPLIEHADKKKTFQYKPVAPYAGTGGNTLADVAMYYWNRDLREDLPNNVADSASEDAFWQHMVNYTIGFGVNGNRRNSEDLAALSAGLLDWGSPATDANARIDDLWHAAINSRGKAKSASDITGYADALKSVVQDIQATTRSETGIAVSGRSYSASAHAYVPSYQTGEWSGDVEAVLLSNGAKVWRASEELPEPDKRNIHTFDDTTSKGLPLKLDALNLAGMTSLLGVSDAPGLLQYLRGDRSGEGSTYRKRSTPLGDIVNSSPVLVKDLVDSRYDFLSGSTPGRSTYLSFLNAKKYRTAQLFVGANDGMLHAFNAGDDQKTMGAETFAFMPRTVLGSVKALADPAYTHRYFVDGPLVEVDVYDTGSTKWRNLVLGGGGAGAKNLFAINVPVSSLLDGKNPKLLTDEQSAPGATDILWERASDHPDFAELGFVLQTPKSGILRDGRWAIVVGNGYESAGGRAQLYLIDAVSGARIAVFDTVTGSTAEPNGLGGVELVLDGAKRIVAAYAGDLHGNLWKFDLSSATPAQWGVAFGGKPLFKASNSSGAAEPITAAPLHVRHPVGGVMVFAGSGKLFETGDTDVQAQRTLYGVWDKVAIGTHSGNADDRLTDNDSLVTQTITSLEIGGASGKYYAVSDNAVDYGTNEGAQKRGWKIRLTVEAGQRLIYDPQVEGGRVFFDTFVPGASADECATRKPYVLSFVLDPFTGAPGRGGPTFDTNGDESFTSADNATAAATRYSTLGQRAIVRLSDDKVSVRGSGEASTNGRTVDGEPVNLGKAPIRRQWRQIVIPPSY